MRKAYYRIRNHGDRIHPLWSVDEVNEDGHFINQVAFFFKTAAAARKRAKEIEVEDLNDPHCPTEWEEWKEKK